MIQAKLTKPNFVLYPDVSDEFAKHGCGMKRTTIAHASRRAFSSGIFLLKRPKFNNLGKIKTSFEISASIADVTLGGWWIWQKL
jgi:hypothetical protein